MERPLTLTVVVVLQWVAALIAAISGFDLLLAALELKDRGLEGELDSALVRQGVIDIPGSALITAVFVAAVVILAVAVLRVIAAVYLARGRSWARILVAIFATLNLVGGLAFLFEGYWQRALLTVALELIVLALLFTGSSNDYIRMRSAATVA
ncbi:MAG: hypothetical protein GC156_00135 [Actinomycetales bacterium]|nr:hypothetical protein [Actinomycetales bacterium]